MAVWGREQEGLQKVGAGAEEREGCYELNQVIRNRKCQGSIILAQQTYFLQVNFSLSLRERKGHETTQIIDKRARL